MALTAIERKRVQDAFDTLTRHNKNPFIGNFLKEQPKPKSQSLSMTKMNNFIYAARELGKRRLSVSNQLLTQMDSFRSCSCQSTYHVCEGTEDGPTKSPQVSC